MYYIIYEALTIYSNEQSTVQCTFYLSALALSIHTTTPYRVPSRHF